MDFRQAIEAALPAEAFVTDASEKSDYARDWTRIYEPSPGIVVRPSSTQEVSRALRLASEYGVKVVPSGGRTGLAGGAMAAQGELVLSLDRIRHLHPVDRTARTVVVGAGAVTASVHDHTRPYGLTWPVDFASSGSSQIGGNIATNAGGVRVVRYGLTRQWVLGLEVVLASGDVLQLNGRLEKNNTGVDLRQLFIGSEGTLGVITEATLKLSPLPPATRVALLAVENLQAALAVFGRARAESRIVLQAFEYLSHRCLDLVLSETGESHPFAETHGAYVLVEFEPGPGADLGDASEAWLESIFEEGIVMDAVLSNSDAEAQRLWSYRERISESLSKVGLVHKNDVALPVSQLPEFTTEFEQTLGKEYPDFGVYIFGHVGDGNLHVNIMKPAELSKDEFLGRVYATDSLLFSLIQRYQGSVSAEHGIGLLKKKALPYSRSPQELEIFKGMKRVLDPKNILNPGKIFDLD